MGNNSSPPNGLHSVAHVNKSSSPPNRKPKGFSPPKPIEQLRGLPPSSNRIVQTAHAPGKPPDQGTQPVPPGVVISEVRDNITEASSSRGHASGTAVKGALTDSALPTLAPKTTPSHLTSTSPPKQSTTVPQKAKVSEFTCRGFKALPDVSFASVRARSR